MRPSRARDGAAKAAGFAAPPRGKTFFPLERGCRGSPAASKPPFSFSEEKENAPFDGVREKGSGGGIPDFVRNARSAYYGGFSLAVICGLCLLCLPLTPTELRVPPGYTAVLFSLPHPGIRGSLRKCLCQSPATTGLRQQNRSRVHPGAPLPPIVRNCQGAAAKRERQSIPEFPQLSQLPYSVEWAKARRFPPGQTPVTDGKRRFKRSLKCRRQRLFS